jgi:hypothetical protein
MNTALGLPAARYTTPAVTTAAGGLSQPLSGLAYGPVPSAALRWCSEGEMPTATATTDGPYMRPALDPSAMVPA